MRNEQPVNVIPIERGAEKVIENLKSEIFEKYLNNETLFTAKGEASIKRAINKVIIRYKKSLQNLKTAQETLEDARGMLSLIKDYHDEYHYLMATSADTDNSRALMNIERKKHDSYDDLLITLEMIE